MQKILATALLLSLSLSAPVMAQELCIPEKLSFDPSRLAKGRTVTVLADNAQIIQDSTAQFDGNVEIASPSALINADEARINNSGQEVIASGDVLYQDAGLELRSEGIELNTQLKLLQMQDTDYKLTGISGRGAAELLSLSGERGLRLEDVSFTTCPKGGEDWKIQASEITIGKDKPFGEAYNTRFYLAGVPVFYLPYFAFPVTSERQTGLLFPKIGSSSSVGLDYEQPFYWNIAPNYDAVLSPRYMTNRGLQLKTEFRYLSEQHRGEIQLEYMPEDLDTEDGNERYFYRYVHQGKLNDNWHLNVDFSGLSDDNYIVDLGSDYYNRADTHLYRQLGLSYYSESISYTMQFRDFEVIGDHPDVYRALPEMKFNYANAPHEYLAFNLASEFAYFQNAIRDRPEAIRLHVEPSISIPYQRAWGELLAEISVLNTYYYQNNIEQDPSLKEEVNRTLGQARLYGSLVFEKPQTINSRPYTLSIEPKVQYLYTSYQDQSDIGLYDTTALLTTYNNLFRGQEFTGLDRINDNNQFTVGATARLVDSQNRETLAFSLGQIFYVKDAKLGASTRTQNSSALAAELDWQVNQRWFLHSDIQIASNSDKVERSSVATEYRVADNKLVQLNHRYIRDLSGEQIDQFGVTASWPISKKWQWVGRWYRDAKQARTTETFMGLQYESCCWALRLIVQRNLSNRFDNDGLRSTDEFDSGVSLQFVFKGMGSERNSTEMLEQGMFGYRQPYMLNQ